ncbi:MAG: xanthine dehydrogenase family protein molybdopterin-binding subunit [Betaproteobacteria bacterium]|nr:xanthine dehydrogenase family protein molybdopterin-binding subunit [Betaproteobacteria bacterium]
MNDSSLPQGIGAPVLRKEDFRFLTGRGRYTSNLRVAGETHAAFVRSPYAHADIRGMNTAPALKIPGVIAVLTGADMAADGVGVLDLDFVARHHDGRPMCVPERRALSIDRVRYVGEPLAIVIADTAYAARDGAEAVEVEYAERPTTVGLAESVAEGAPQLWDGAPNNVACDFRYGMPGDVATAFGKAAHVVTLRHVNNRVAVNPMEPRAALAWYDPLEQRYSLYLSHQTPHPLRTQLAETFHVPEQRVHVVSQDVGGGFGVKGPTYPEEVAVCWAARRTGRPVKWVCERSELFLSDAQARDHLTTLEVALDAEGHFLAFRVEDLANLGAYVSSFGAGPPMFGQSSLLAGVYRVPFIAGRVRMLFTNTMPTDAYRGPGRAECIYMVERAVDLAARKLKLSPVEIRRRNMIPAASMPWKAPTGRIYDCGDFPAVFEKALARADWAGFAARRDGARSRGKLRGLGIACYIDNTGIGPSQMVMARGMKSPTYESAIVRLNKDGGVTVVTGTHTHGQGLETALAQIVAQRLGVRVEDVEVLHGDTREIGYGRGTVGARSLLAGGAALEVAIAKVVEKGRRIAAHLLECAAEDVEHGMESQAGRFKVKGTDRSVSLAEVARAAFFPANYPMQTLEPGLEESGYWDPKGVAFPYGCHICEIEIDRDSGVLQVVGFVSVDDFGNIVNPLLVAGQVHGGIAQGLGQAMLEHCVHDPATGQILTGSLMDYGLPRADDMPAIDHVTHPGFPCASNPLGVKGCGEAGAIGAPPALVNAVVDALSEFNVEHADMPLTSQVIWRLMHPA